MAHQNFSLKKPVTIIVHPTLKDVVDTVNFVPKLVKAQPSLQLDTLQIPSLKLAFLVISITKITDFNMEHIVRRLNQFKILELSKYVFLMDPLFDHQSMKQIASIQSHFLSEEFYFIPVHNPQDIGESIGTLIKAKLKDESLSQRSQLQDWLQREYISGTTVLEILQSLNISNEDAYLLYDEFGTLGRILAATKSELRRTSVSANAAERLLGFKENLK